MVCRYYRILALRCCQKVFYTEGGNIGAVRHRADVLVLVCLRSHRKSTPHTDNVAQLTVTIFDVGYFGQTERFYAITTVVSA